LTSATYRLRSAGLGLSNVAKRGKRGKRGKRTLARFLTYAHPGAADTPGRGMKRSGALRLTSRVGCIAGILCAVLVLAYWMLNPSDMWTGGRPRAVGALMLICLGAASVFYVVAKRVKR
jgi:hypothetical protein